MKVCHGPRHAALRVGAALGACALAVPVAARPNPHLTVNWQARPLGEALQGLALAGHVTILIDGDAGAHRLSPPLNGRFSIEEALARLLAGSGLVAKRIQGGFVVKAADPDPQDLEASTPAGDIVVTGSRIRNARAASPVITLGREGIRNSGQASFAEAFQTLPQNFGGGQNPGIGQEVPEASGADIGGGASVNLRGIGSDATLTLLDGRRLSYNAATQSIDISAIPFNAIDRVEIVPDGASALFGSDAVAGVVNIILRRDYDGAEVGGRVAGSTEGGNLEQQYHATFGRTWSSGSILGAYEYGSNSAIVARQRDYAAARSPGVTLYPAIRHHNAASTFRQDLGVGITLDIDGLYDKRWTDLAYPLNFAGDLDVSREQVHTKAQSWNLAPALTWRLPTDWEIVLSGALGRDRVDYRGDEFDAGVLAATGAGTYRNTARNIELSGDGKLLDLAGGSAKLALGAGYRSIGFRRDTVAGFSQHISPDQQDYYAFSELNLPIVGSGNARPWIRRLDASAALRYERYPGVGQVATPKLGLIFAPSDDVEFKASWGKSFRAPTLYQRFQPPQSYLIAATSLGGASAPPGATALLLIGGSPVLKPERSTNWSATLNLHPQRLAGLNVEVSYFNVAYRDRIVSPILSYANALSDPLYTKRVTLNPSAAAQAAALQGTTFTDISGGAGYDPASVYAIVDGRIANASRQRISGLDVLARYETQRGADHWSGSLNASYLRSNQRIGPGYPITPLAGQLYNPPHWRTRGEVGWARGPVTLTADLSYVGSVLDRRSSQPVRVDGMLPVDLTARYRRPIGRRALDGIDVTLGVQNLFDDRPTPIATTLFYDTPYDSTNYSPLGRVVSLAVAKSW